MKDYIAGYRVDMGIIRMTIHPLVLIAMELDGPQAGAPLAELIHPVVQRGLGHNNQVWPVDAPELRQVAQQGDGLQRLAQALQEIGYKFVSKHSGTCVTHLQVNLAVMHTIRHAASVRLH